MNIHYMDPSAWVKRHFHEAGSDAMNALFRLPVTAACSALGIVEMIATVARKCGQQSVATSVGQGIVDNIRADAKAFRITPVDESRLLVAEELAMHHQLRGMDAIHLASAFRCTNWAMS